MYKRDYIIEAATYYERRHRLFGAKDIAVWCEKKYGYRPNFNYVYDTLRLAGIAMPSQKKGEYEKLLYQRPQPVARDTGRDNQPRQSRIVMEMNPKTCLGCLVLLVISPFVVAYLLYWLLQFFFWLTK